MSQMVIEGDAEQSNDGCGVMADLRNWFTDSY